MPESIFRIDNDRTDAMYIFFIYYYTHREKNMTQSECSKYGVRSYILITIKFLLERNNHVPPLNLSYKTMHA